jgi:GNAT superfamily N-acetyltransferase
MGRVTVRPLQPGDLDTCAGLLAARQRVLRARLPMLATSLEEPAACRSLLERAAGNPRITRFVAERDGRVVGFLSGEEMLFPPDHFASQYIPLQSLDMPVEGHAVAEAEDATDVYRALYAVLSGEAVARGLFTQRVHIIPDPALQEAWLSLGFGRHLTAAVRETALPVEDGVQAPIDVHQASAEDIDVIIGLHDTLNRHHLQPPMFWPILPAPQPAAREYDLAHLADTETNPYFVAYLDGRPVAMQTFNKPGFIPPVVEQESNIYLYEGVVEEDVRTGGVGAALLDRTMSHLRDHSFRWCTLHFAAGNPSGAPFWLKHQFIPVEHEMERRIDERVTWARG